jgi:large subunit ribosomal protein L23
MSKTPVEVIYGPVITERSYSLHQQGRYTFRVARDASKPEIARALEEQYQAQGVKVASVNTVNVIGKRKRLGGRGPLGRTSNWKKAVVTLKEGRLEGLFGSV